MEQTQSTRSGWFGDSVPVRALFAVVLASLVNAGIVFATQTLEIAPDFMALRYPPVVFLTHLGVLGAAAVYSQLDRFVAARERAFRRIAVVVLVISFVPDVALLAVDPAATVAGVVVLMAMHVVVAGVAVGLLAGFPGGDR